MEENINSITCVKTAEQMDYLLEVIKHKAVIGTTIGVRDIHWKNLTPQQWETFVEEFIYNSDKLCKMVHIKNNFKVHIHGGYLTYIGYE